MTHHSLFIFNFKKMVSPNLESAENYLGGGNDKKNNYFQTGIGC